MDSLGCIWRRRLGSSSKEWRKAKHKKEQTPLGSTSFLKFLKFLFCRLHKANKLQVTTWTTSYNLDDKFLLLVVL
jgi:hypothetical protein